MHIQTFQCPNCGAALSANALKAEIAACEYCGTTFRLAKSPTPEPDMGDVLLAADFRDPQVPGWLLSNPDKIRFLSSPQPELFAFFPSSDLIYPVLRTPGPFDDFDVSVTIRFTEGNYEYISAGIEFRYSSAGDYVARISAQGTYSLGWHEKSTWGGSLVEWSTHPSMRKQIGQPNRLRIIARGARLRMYINGVLAASLLDSKFNAGLIRISISSGNHSSIGVAFSDLQLREAPRELKD